MTSIYEFIILTMVIGSGAVFWSIHKAPKYLNKMLADETGLRKLLIGENGELLLNEFNSNPMPGDYFIERINSILNSCRNEYNKPRYISLIVALLLIGGSLYLGKMYLVFNIFAFVFLSTIEMAGPLRKNLVADIVAIATGIAKWNGVNPAECGEYCAARPDLKLLHRVVTGK